MSVESPILVRGVAALSSHSAARIEAPMVETRIKPYFEQQAEKERREEQRHLQAQPGPWVGDGGGGILLWWLLHTNPKWIFPPGWWRLTCQSSV